MTKAQQPSDSEKLLLKDQAEDKDALLCFYSASSWNFPSRGNGKEIKSLQKIKKEIKLTINK